MFENDFGRNNSTALNIVGGTGYGFLDSPSTTSETTYKCDVTCTVPTLRTNKTTQDGNNTLGIRGMSTMTLFEVVA